MIFVIGDIHGMIKPLERLLEAIRKYHKKVEEVQKIIFIGDYGDFGKHTKEVIDTLINLDFPKVLLAGNHDDTAAHFFRKVDISKQMSWKMFLRYNGVKNTLFSLLESNKFFKFSELEYNLHDREDEEFDVLYPEQKYIDFFVNLKYSHKETLNCGDYGNINFRFFHALPRIDQTLDEQSVLTFDDYELYIRKKFKQFDDDILDWFYQYRTNFYDKIYKISPISYPDYTFLWNRMYNFKFAYEGDVIIHGHTPTVMFDKSYADGHHVPPDFQPLFSKYKNLSSLPFLFSRDKNAGYSHIPELTDRDRKCVFSCGKHFSIEAINVDTGAVYKGGALTALGLSEKKIAKNKLVALTTFTTKSDFPERYYGLFEDQRLKALPPLKPKVILRTIKVRRLGADISDAKHNPLFPFEEFRNADNIIAEDE
ncbi:MAG: metallophosphoesterase [Rickettsiales bacterium]|jgi:predicted phosphodiesterase|nr:metallophosphoesterase [Rickettsiales bacterium]